MSSFYGGGAASNDSSGSGNAVNNNSIYKFFTVDAEASAQAQYPPLDYVWKWKQGQTPDNLDDFFIPVLVIPYDSTSSYLYIFPQSFASYKEEGNSQKIQDIQATYIQIENNLMAQFDFYYDQNDDINIELNYMGGIGNGNNEGDEGGGATPK